jgi:hypothetical protein
VASGNPAGQEQGPVAGPGPRSFVSTLLFVLPDFEVVVRAPPERAQSIELLALRHEVRGLQRQGKRPGRRPADRLFLVALSRRRPRGEWRRLPGRPERLRR